MFSSCFLKQYFNLFVKPAYIFVFHQLKNFHSCKMNDNNNFCFSFCLSYENNSEEHRQLDNCCTTAYKSKLMLKKGQDLNSARPGPVKPGRHSLITGLAWPGCD